VFWTQFRNTTFYLFTRFPREQYSEYSLPLLSDDSDDSSDEDELFHPGGRVRLPRSASAPGQVKFREFDDEFYLRDQREWTSVRDSHVRSAADLADQQGMAAPADGEDVPQVLRQQEKGSKPPPPPPLADVDLLSD
jgi:hypothetical protein